MIDDDVGFDEPAQDAQQIASNDRNTVAIATDLDRVKSSLNEFDRVSAGLAELAARYPKDAIYEVGTTKGMKDAIEHRAAWREPRITVEKARKMAKAPLLALGKSIDARAGWITEQLTEGEQPIDQLIKAEESRKEAEKQAKINAEMGRVLAIQEALAEIGQNVLIAGGKTSADIRALLDAMSGTEPDKAVFQEMIGQAIAARTAGIDKLETALKAKLWDEAEQARIEAERASEAERRAEEARQLAAQKAENDRIAAEQKARDDAFAAERAEFARQQAEFKADQARAAKAVFDASNVEVSLTLPDQPIQIIKPAIIIELEDAPPEFIDAEPEEQPVIKLSQINEWIAPFKIDTEGMASLGFVAATVKSARLYKLSDEAAMKAAMLKHFQSIESIIPF